MPAAAHTADALVVASRFAGLAPLARAAPLGNHGGFSGARLWRLDSACGPVCLRAWPGEATASQLSFSHDLMRHARATGLAFVPRLHLADGRTWSEHAGRLWDACEWLPGATDNREHLSPARLESACQALALLHQAWQTLARSEGVPPAIRRRLDVAREWDLLVRSGWRPLAIAPADDPVRPVAERAWAVVPRRLETMRQVLCLADCVRPLQPCHVDPWHGNLLFVEERLSGIVDYGAARIDHPALDVARLLGSAAGAREDDWQLGLAAYRAVRQFSHEDEALARVLEQTGVVAAAANWLLRLYHDRRSFADRTAVAARLATVVARLEQVAP